MGQQDTAGKVWLVGAGPGDPDLLTLRAHRLISTARVVAYDRLVGPQIMALIPKGARLVPVGKAAGAHLMPQDQISALLVTLALEGSDVIRLKGGDPFIFGRGGEELEVLRAAGIRVEVVPGITAAQAAGAAAQVPLTHRGLASGLRYVTGHRAMDAVGGPDWAGLAHDGTTLVVYMGGATLRAMAAGLIEAGRAPATPVLAVSRATLPDERRVLTRLDRVGEASELPTPVLFIIGEVAGLYLPDALQVRTCPP